MISNVSIQIRIVPIEPNRVGGQPAAYCGVVPTVDVVLKLRRNVKRFAGVGEKDGVCAGNEVAECVVNEVSGFSGGKDVADGAEMVGE